jgi:hypothetical protein
MREENQIEYTKEQQEQINAYEKQHNEDARVVMEALQKYFDKYNSIIVGVNSRCMFNQWNVSFSIYGQALRDRAIIGEKK